MSNEKTEWKQLAKFISYEVKNLSKKEGEEFNKIIIRYTQPNSRDPSSEWSVGILENDADDSLVEKIAGLEAGQSFGVHTGKDGSGYNVLKGILDVKDIPAPKSGGYGGKGGYDKGYTPKDETGVAVGGAWTNALTILEMHEAVKQWNADAIVAEADRLARLIWAKKHAFENEIRATAKATISKTETVEPKAEEVKPVDRMAAAKARALEASKKAQFLENKPESAKPKAAEVPFSPDEEVEDDIIQ